MPEVKVGQVVQPLTLPTLDGQTTIPDRDQLVHLKFVRFAGCPACSYQLRVFVKRLDELKAANIKEVVVFHSSAEDIRQYEKLMPFVIVPDPEKQYYAKFGADRTQAHAAMSPSVLLRMPAFASGIIMGKSKVPPMSPHGGQDGLLADFLIAPNGKVVAAKYGETMIDGWTVDEVLSLAKQAKRL